MKRLGAILMTLGVAMGAVFALALAIGLKVGDVPFLVAIGLGKLSFLVAATVMGVGAWMRRLGIRQEHRELREADTRSSDERIGQS